MQIKPKVPAPMTPGSFAKLSSSVHIWNAKSGDTKRRRVTYWFVCSSSVSYITLAKPVSSVASTSAIRRWPPRPFVCVDVPLVSFQSPTVTSAITLTYLNQSEWTSPLDTHDRLSNNVDSKLPDENGGCTICSRIATGLEARVGDDVGTAVGKADGWAVGCNVG